MTAVEIPSVTHLIAALAATEDDLRELRGLPLDDENREKVRAITQRRADIIHDLRSYHAYSPTARLRAHAQTQ